MDIVRIVIAASLAVALSEHPGETLDHIFGGSGPDPSLSAPALQRIEGHSTVSVPSMPLSR